MKILKKIFFIILLIVAGLLAFALFLPSERHIEKKLSMKAPIAKVYKQVSNLKNWVNWSPWEKSDSTIKTVYSGSKEGVGAIMSWTSENSGNGKMEIVEARKNKMLKTVLAFEGAGESDSYWYFRDFKDSVEVTWTMDMKDLGYPIGRLMGYFMSGMVENSYEDGLRMLAEAAINMKCPEMEVECGKIEEKEVSAQPALVIKTMTTMETISQSLGEIYGKVMAHIEANNIQTTGAPLSIYYSNDPNATEWEMAAGIPIAEKVEGSGEIECVDLYQGKVLAVSHCGGYENLGKTYGILFQYVAQKGYEQNGASWESYLTDPQEETDTSKWITDIYLPIK